MTYRTVWSVHRFYTLPILFWATACGTGFESGKNSSRADNSSGSQEIDGYGDIKFGSSLQDALAANGPDLFNRAAIQECLSNLPLKGCFLSKNINGSPFQIKDGIPYMLSLSFNRHDKLTDIDLNYDREGDISRAQCLEIHERTLDWLVREYGEMRTSKFKLEPGSLTRTTAGKHSYMVSSDKSDFFVTRPMRTASTETAIFENQPITKWDNKRYMSLLTHFIVVDGKPICGVNVSFSEPDIIERRVD